jgi:hypothetical protein
MVNNNINGYDCVAPWKLAESSNNTEVDEEDDDDEEEIEGEKEWYTTMRARICLRILFALQDLE